MKRTPIALSLTALVLLLVVAAGLFTACKSPQAPPPLKVTLAETPFLYSGLIAIADEKGFFREAGIEVAIQEYPSGLMTLDKLDKGEVQMATLSDLVFGSQALDNPSLRIVATIASADTTEVVARKDRGIAGSANLRGKRVGVSFGTSGQYYLSRFLQVNAIPRSEVTAVNICPDKLGAALINGDVDAIVTWDKHSYQAIRQLGDGGTVFSAQNGRDFFWVLAVREDYADSPEVRRVLSAIKKAEEFALLDDAEARTIVKRRWAFEEEFMRLYWNKTRLSLILNQPLVLDLEDAEDWKLEQEPEQSKKRHDVTKYIDSRALGDIDPLAVTIFR